MCVGGWLNRHAYVQFEVCTCILLVVKAHSVLQAHILNHTVDLYVQGNYCTVPIAANELIPCNM